MRCIDQHPSLTGKVVLVRTGLNTPMHEGEVINDFRIRRALPTLQFLREQGAKTIVIAHIGREQHESLREVAQVLNEHIPTHFSTREDLRTDMLLEGDVVLLENLRQDPREVANDDAFAQELAALADVFVQDAFSVCHREHASIVGIPKYIESYAGLLLKAETTTLNYALSPQRPALFILGGAKFKTKEPLIRKFLDEYDRVLVGGALQNEILAARGLEVGNSVIEDGAVPMNMLENEKLQEVLDVVVERGGESTTVASTAVEASDTIVDLGEETVAALTAEIANYKTILWNGPLGWYEKGFDASTVHLARAVAKSDAQTIIGGGDTVAVIQKEGFEDDFDFVSTGGGAMLEYLLNKTLPGIDALS